MSWAAEVGRTEASAWWGVADVKRIAAAGEQNPSIQRLIGDTPAIGLLTHFVNDAISLAVVIV